MGLADKPSAQFVNALHVWQQYHFPVLDSYKLRLVGARILDEAHVYASIAEVQAGDSVFATGIFRDRKRGWALILASQMSSLLHPIVSSQCLTKIVMRTGSYSEAAAAGQELWGKEVSSHHIQCLRCLPPGYALMLHPRSSRPFLVKIHRLKPAPPFTRASLRQRAFRILYDAGYVEEPLGTHMSPPASPVNQSTHTANRAAEPPSTTKSSMPATISADTLAVIKAAASDTCSLANELMQLCNIEGKRWNNVKNELCALTQLVELVQLNTGLRGRQPMWVRVLEECYKSLGITPIPRIAQSGVQYIHRFWLTRIARKLQPTFKHVQIDKSIAGKRVDVSAVDAQDRQVGFECERQDQQKDLLLNVAHDFVVCNLAFVTVLVSSQKQRRTALETLRTHLTPEHFARVKVEPLGSYL